MSSKLFMILNKPSLRLNQTQISSESALIASSNVINGRRGYYTTSRPGKETLYAKISPLGSPGISVKPELDGWMQKGKKVSVAELSRIIQDLRKRKRYTQALEVFIFRFKSCIGCLWKLDNKLWVWLNFLEFYLIGESKLDEMFRVWSNQLEWRIVLGLGDMHVLIRIRSCGCV